MDQFNKVLAAFLILVVAVGISLFIFSRLGVLDRILPTNNTVERQQQVSPTTTPTTIITQTKQTTTPSTTSGILGWFSQLGKPNPSPTKTQPTPLPPSTQQVIHPTKQAEVVEDNNVVRVEPNTTIIPYGSTSATTYPASGAEIIHLPLLTTLTAVGLLLKNKAKG